MFDLNTSHIRFWENEFDILKPKKNAKGNRFFTKEDIANLHIIYNLVKERGMTLKGAKQKLKDNKENTIKNIEVIRKLQSIKAELIEFRDMLE